MNWNRVEGNWRQLKGKVKEQGANLPMTIWTGSQGSWQQLRANSVLSRELALHFKNACSPPLPLNRLPVQPRPEIGPLSDYSIRRRRR